MRRVWRTPKLSNSRCQFLSQNPFYIQTLHLILLLLSLPTTPQPWDGIIVTESDYQSLQAFKHELVDPNGALSSWNVTAAGACSGSWIGIKCAQGQVIVIHLPRRGLSGRITERIGQFQALRKLSLHDNSIGGAVPTALGFLRNLRGVQLFNNRLSGTIPASLGFCALLQTLELGNNSLSGMIPDSLGNSSKLIRLSLGHNSLSGPIPDSLFTLKNLSVLNLHGNFLDGLIPDAVMSLSSIRDLDLSHNRLSGGIPRVLAELPHLESLNLSYNNLSSSVPQALSHRFNSLAFTGNPHLSSSSLSSNNIAPPPAARRSRKKDVILIVSGVLCITLIATCCIILSCGLIRKRKANAGLPPTEVGGKLVHFDLVAFAADDLLCASAEVLGRSMYGTMYKTTMENGVHVAVKRLREKITKGEKEFESEVHGLGRIRHPNVLAIRSYYVGSKGQKLLVFDYLPRGNLANVLHGNLHGAPVGWPARVAMAKGIARGLLHLHEDAGIVHGNLTSNNVLLDEHMNVKVADFGLSKLMTEVANAHAAATAGVFGYWAPEHTKTKFKKATTKSDVYSFGVIMLELLTGRSPIDVDLPRWVASIVREGWTNEVFDLELLRDASALGDELVNGLKLALHCIDPVPSARPEAVEILWQLEEIRVEAYGGSS